MLRAAREIEADERDLARAEFVDAARRLQRLQVLRERTVGGARIREQAQTPPREHRGRAAP